MILRRITRACVVITANFACAHALGGTQGVTLYVDDNALPGGNGLQWSSAFRRLQDGLDAARLSPRVIEVHVAQGVYRPDQGDQVQPGDKNASFMLVSGTTLRGGYAGFGANDPDERDVTRFPTVLSGDLLENDQPG